MIWFTGDIHGDMDFFKRPEIKKIKKDDFLIVCGDFGFIWDDSKEENKILKWIGSRKFNVLFIDGCHENFDLLEKYEISDQYGGKARIISGNLMQLMRGEIYNIEGKRIFSFGGGHSDDRDEREKGITWWEQEKPTPEQADNAIDNLLKAQGEVDIIVTHEVPSSLIGCFDNNLDVTDFTLEILEKIRKHCTFKKWYFGKYHKDRVIPPHYRALFNDIVPYEG